MILIIAAAAAGSMTAWEAERRYSAAASLHGQWTAFRETAAPDALMFVPQPRKAVQWLQGRADPPVAVVWWPARSWLSCDGRLAVNFGPWLRKGGTLAGTFTTIWVKQEDGSWRWKLDRGSNLPRPLPAADVPRVTTSSCANANAAHRTAVTAIADRDILVQLGDKAPAAGATAPPGGGDGALLQSGESPDGTLRWDVRQIKGAPEGEHVVRVWRWDGRRHDLAVYESTREN
ncbi:MAG: hypothetical protein JWO81_2009 [Alphaproteobacteria bacterium]|nr:hypothetical protein [Alphaproteobacteria bacterium]